MSPFRGKRLLVGLVAALPLSAVHAQATVEGLLARLEAQERSIQALKSELEVLKQSATPAKLASSPVADAPVVKASDAGFSLQSADGANQLKLRGLLHVDGRYVADGSPELVDQWQLTRVRPIIEGTLGGIYDFRFMPDFGQGRTLIVDAYLRARFLPGLAVTAGKFKSPVGLERLQSANDIRWVARGFPTSLAPNRDLGLVLSGEGADRRLTWDLAWLNGADDGASVDRYADQDVNDDKDWAARVFAHPFAAAEGSALRGLGIGIAGTWVDQEGDATQSLLSTYRTPAQSIFFRYRGGATPTFASGERSRLAPQFYYYAGPFGLIGEYTEVSQDVARVTDAGLRTGSVDTFAWQLAASWFLTGEKASFRGYTPNSELSLEKGTWGAFELVARYQQLDVDDAAFNGGDLSFADPAVSARRASSWGIGVNWYLSRNTKWVLNYEQTSFAGGAPDGRDREDEEAFLTRFAVGF